ncbi:hypothetical protein NX059_009969 [Plenodomus lindquistii]|nr:hypothetical protein NX059_009969 [Plenodomus lindquistii]
MDHWGDPWSDNGNDASITKTEVTSPLPRAQTSAPVLLNGFLDDAGWGSEDASFGDWATPPQSTVPTATVPHVPVEDASRPVDHDFDRDSAQLWGEEEHSESLLPTVNRDCLQNHHDEIAADGVPSEASDSATTVQQDGHPDDATLESSGHLQPDDASSARPSTSLSEGSHNGPPADSPRTSVEEDRGAVKSSVLETIGLADHAAEDQQAGNEGSELLEKDMHEEATGALAKDDSNNTPPEPDVLSSEEEQDSPRELISDDEEFKLPIVQSSAKDAMISDRTLTQNAPSYDAVLLDELFPPLQGSVKQEEAPEDPIYSTSGRKAWYRLTRRQTLREYNSGNADDNYVRVTWANSEIRKEVNKTVGRWAREDRLSGTGAGARASFYWDTAAPPDPKIPMGHSRTKTSVPTPRAAIPARHSLPPVTTNVPVAFNWSSATAVDPWQLDSPALRSTSSPLTARPVVSESLAKAENRAVSMSIASPDLGTREQVSNTLPETSRVTSLIAPPPITPALPTFPEQWNKSNSIGTSESIKAEIEVAAIDDEDEWGEMVGSPTLAESQTSEAISPATLINNINSTPPAVPPPNRSFSAQKQFADGMHTAHTTRLRGTISPTSAIFGARSFVPLGTEQGPIGPAILKPIKRPEPLVSNGDSKKPLSAGPAEVVVVHEPHNGHAEPVEGPRDEVLVGVPHLEPAFVPVEKDEFSTFTSSAPAAPSVEPSISHTSAVTEQRLADAWTDADFSFFESAPPIAVSTPSKASGPDVRPIYDTPTQSARPSSAASSKSFARSPPRTSPPAIQPLTSATNAAQRRKDEEEKTIRDILGGLPNLGYMLR